MGIAWATNSMIGESTLKVLWFSILNTHRQAGAGGGLVASIATCPLDVVKTKLQAQRISRGQVGYEGVIGE